MGAGRSRIIANSSALDDKHPILDSDYGVSEYFVGRLCQRYGNSLSFNTQAYSFKSRLLNEMGRSVSNGKLELTFNELLYQYTDRKEIKIVRWPLTGLRGYGYCEHLFTFEAGRRCTTCKCLFCLVLFVKDPQHWVFYRSNKFLFIYNLLFPFLKIWNSFLFLISISLMNVISGLDKLKN